MIDPNIAPAITQLALEKTALRKQLLAQRKAMPTETRVQAQEAHAAHLLEWLEHWREDSTAHDPDASGHAMSDPVIGVFWPVSGEPDLAPLYATLRTRGFTLALPVAPARHHALEYRLWDGVAPRQRDASGVPAPLEAALCEVGVVLIPCVGVHPQGWRLGYGGGYFDRTLAAWEDRPGAAPVFTIGIAFEQQRCHFEVDVHDRRLDALATEHGVQVWPPRAAR